MSSTHPPEPDDDASPAELRAFIRTNVIKTVVTLLVLFVALAVVGKLYQAELIAAAEAVYQRLGVGGLLGLLFIGDAIFSPVPPDTILVIIANSELRASWASIVLAVGVVSTVAGNFGWWLGWRFARFPPSSRIIARVRKKYATQIHRYDRWTVALGATTPLPFSLICITAGALGMRWNRVAPVTLLRIPRFFLFYVVIAYSSSF